MNRPVFQMGGGGTPRTPLGEPLGSQPVGEPGHVAVAVERVGDKVQGLQGHQGVERPRGHAADGVGVQAERLEVHEAVEDLFVDLPD